MSSRSDGLLYHWPLREITYRGHLLERPDEWSPWRMFNGEQVHISLFMTKGGREDGYTFTNVLLLPRDVIRNPAAYKAYKYELCKSLDEMHEYAQDDRHFEGESHDDDEIPADAPDLESERL